VLELADEGFAFFEGRNLRGGMLTVLLLCQGNLGIATYQEDIHHALVRSIVDQDWMIEYLRR
jgi:hypothetical protein